MPDFTVEVDLLPDDSAYVPDAGPKLYPHAIPPAAHERSDLDVAAALDACRDEAIRLAQAEAEGHPAFVRAWRVRDAKGKVIASSKQTARPPRQPQVVPAMIGDDRG